MINQTTSFDCIHRTILDEIYKAIGLSPSTWLHFLLDPIFNLPLRKFCPLVYTLNTKVSNQGMTYAASWVLPNFYKEVKFYGEKDLPKSGSLMVISNHPGSFDSVCLTAGINRDDLKIIVYESPFYRTLPAVSSRLIFTNSDPIIRMGALRRSIRHLKDGGALLLFGTGSIDPDPVVMKGAHIELEKWSESISIILKQIPELQVVISIVGGVVSPKFANIWLAHLRQKPIDKRRLIEFLQVMYQMLFNNHLNLTPEVHFSPCFSAKDILASNTYDQILNIIIHKAKSFLHNITKE